MVKPEVNHRVNRTTPALLKSGERALRLFAWKADGQKKKPPSQVVSGIDTPELTVNGGVCSIIKDDYFSPETCDGDYNKRVLDGCCFPTVLLENAFDRLMPGSQIEIPVKAFFHEIYHVWGTDYDELHRESEREEEATVSVQWSKWRRHAIITMKRSDLVYAVIKGRPVFDRS